VRDAQFVAQDFSPAGLKTCAAPHFVVCSIEPYQNVGRLNCRPADFLNVFAPLPGNWLASSLLNAMART